VKIEQPRVEAALSADFAHRVVVRVQQARRRRRTRRLVLTCIAAFAAALAITLPAHNPEPRPATVAARSPDFSSDWTTASIESGRAPDSSVVAVSDPLAFFFPGATTVADFESSQATSWHSYDPWWNTTQ
jgi:hypothetical protein